MPAQAAVGQCERDDLPGREPARQRAIGNLDGRTPMNGARQNGEDLQIDLARQVGAFLCHDPFPTDGLAVAKALGQPSEDPLGGEVEQGPEPRGADVDLALGVVLHIAWGQLLVLGDVPRGRSGLDAEARHQVLAADLANKPQAQLDERESVALRLGHFLESVARHGVVLVRIIRVSRSNVNTYTNTIQVHSKKIIMQLREAKVGWLIAEGVVPRPESRCSALRWSHGRQVPLRRQAEIVLGLQNWHTMPT